jgi:hypothetical protein
MSPDTPLSLSRTLGELDAGSLESQATHALALITQAVRDLDDRTKKGKLIIALTVESARGSGQLLITHKLTYVSPTATGKASEEASGDTLMYCGARGALSVLPDTQTKFDFTAATTATLERT